MNRGVGAGQEGDSGAVEHADQFLELGHLLAAEHGKVGERYILGNENLSLGNLLAQLGDLTGLSMPKRRVPYWLAYVSALVSEGIANITKKPPMAPLTGVRLARSSMAFDCSKAQAELNWQCRPLAQSLLDTIQDLDQRGLLTRKPQRSTLKMEGKTSQAAKAATRPSSLGFL